MSASPREIAFDVLNAVERDDAFANLLLPKATFPQVVGTEGLRPDQRTSVPSLVLAGDWTRTDWSATMESAAQSAARAVALLLELPAPA